MLGLLRAIAMFFIVMMLLGCCATAPALALAVPGAIGLFCTYIFCIVLAALFLKAINLASRSV